jgi:hypothetical protein
MKTLKPEYAYKLLTGKDSKGNEYAVILSLHFKCLKQDIINLIESKSEKLTSPNYLVMIKKVLGLPPNVEIAMEVENVA